ncbi:MAG TPA: amidase [Deltaproteobacteria bacterium]|nr:amidase [Deltaproteobacteria bacterium]
MGKIKEYDQYDGLGLAGLIEKKEISAREVFEEAMSRIEELNPRLNAVITKMYDIAARTLEKPLPNGPFKGVPFLVKDLVSACEGVPMTMGSKACKDYVPTYDSELMKRFRKSGVLILGKTNTPEFGLMAITEPELHGPTRNPWNTDHTPGGSSGGSAAAVASGMVPLASGGDGGGSIRIPSSCCALFGLKPSRGRTPTGPDYGMIWQGAAVEHVLTRSVRDSAAMLDVVSGPESGAPFIIPGPQRPFIEEVDQDPGTLRIALCKRSPLGTYVHAECRKAVDQAAEVLKSLGHQLEEAEPDIDGHALARSFFMLYFGEIASDIKSLQKILGRKARPSDVEGPTWALNLLGQAYSAGEFVSAMRQWNIAARQMGLFHQKYDIYLTPTLAFSPVRIGEMQPSTVEKVIMKITNTLRLGSFVKCSGIADKFAIESLTKTPFTQLANLTGQPAMSVPLHWTSAGLPCGVHFTARFGDEATLLRLAGQLEEAQPWFDKRPPSMVHGPIEKQQVI